VKILTATSRTQGQRRDDYYWLTDGEPVYLGMTCDGARADDKCGCARAWTGLDTHKSGTTAQVTDTDLTREQYTARYGESLAAAGWTGIAPADLASMAGELLGIAAHFPAGTVVEHRGRNINARREAAAGGSR
jgi:hypothetical protein